MFLKREPAAVLSPLGEGLWGILSSGDLLGCHNWVWNCRHYRGDGQGCRRPAVWRSGGEAPARGEILGSPHERGCRDEDGVRVLGGRSLHQELGGTGGKRRAGPPAAVCLLGEQLLSCHVPCAKVTRLLVTFRILRVFLVRGRAHATPKMCAVLLIYLL